MPAGRPLKFPSVGDLQLKIDKYFYNCDPHVEEVEEWVEARDKEGKLLKDEHGLSYLVEILHKVKTPQLDYSVTGLAYYLDTSRETLLDYEDKEEYSDTIKKAKDRIHAYVESKLFSNAPTGPIFNLKNNFGWKDKTETDITSGGERITPVGSTLIDELVTGLKHATKQK